MNKNHTEEYYGSLYSGIQRKGLQGLGNSLNDILIERNLTMSPGLSILEIGASSGEHFRFLKSPELLGEYIALDLFPRITNPELAENLENNFPIKFVQGNAESLPFDDNYFDAVISTCVLAHVSNPELVFSELRRVVKPGGQIVIGMPTDPGIANRFVKSCLTYKSMLKAGIENPRLTYANEHVNSIDKLIVFSKHVFRYDQLKFKYFPFKVRSWNLNLMVILKVIKSLSDHAS